MEIKKVPEGWEYDGVIFECKEELWDAIRAQRENPTPKPKGPLPELNLLWHPDMGEDCLEYEIAQYLMQPGNDLQSLRRLINGQTEKRA